MSANTVDPQHALNLPRRAHLTPRFRRRAGAVLDRWPFRRKLNLLVTVPITVVGVMLGIGINNQMEQAQAASRVAALVRSSEHVARLINDVQAEHWQALLLSVRYDSARPGDAPPTITAYRRAQRKTDARIAAVRSAFGSNLPDEEAQALTYIDDLAVLREKIEQGHAPAANIDPAYASAADYLVDGIGLDRSSDASASPVTNLLDAVLRASTAHAAYESGVFSAQTLDANALTEFTRAVGAHTLYTYQSDRFSRIATPDQVMIMSGIERGAEQNGIESRFAVLQVDPSSLQTQTPQQISKASAAGARQAENRLRITRSLIKQIATQADAVSEKALWKASVLFGLALLGFAAWLSLSVLVRHSIVRPLAALTGAAQEVADVAGEELARVADDESADSTPLRPQAIPVPVRDEIGKLAEAFNQVQVTAALLLERQVLSRRNVAEMFSNIGRRISNLTSRQLMLIDAIEREETNPDLLERLYRIDHIAVRLQRNADSLMLLAGIRETGVEAQPTTMANVIRAALGQIEGYQRVALRCGAGVSVAPDIIGDLTLMLAELLENAVVFSPPHTPVEVVVRPGTDIDPDGGALIEIIDHGIGLSTKRLAEENTRLIRRERLDLVPTKVLGLFVVGTLARRWGIRVTLSRTPGGGVTSTLWIPSSLLLTMDPMDPMDATLPLAAKPSETVAALPSKPRRKATAPTPLSVRTTTVPERQSTAPSPQDGLPRRLLSRPGTGQSAALGKPSVTGNPRPLRRRVRGATLSMTTQPPNQGVPAVRPPADADAVRLELDEFEAAVRRAEQDSSLTRTEPAPSLPQAPRKEWDSDHIDK